MHTRANPPPDLGSEVTDLWALLRRKRQHPLQSARVAMFRFLVLLVGLLPLISAFAMPAPGALATSRATPAITSTPLPP